MYNQGLGVPSDAVEAHMWLTIAASRSTGAERESIVTARAASAVRMTPTDLREAERRAQAWHAAHQGMRNRAAPPNGTGREGLIIARVGLEDRAWGRSAPARAIGALLAAQAIEPKFEEHNPHAQEEKEPPLRTEEPEPLAERRSRRAAAYYRRGTHRR